MLLPRNSLKSREKGFGYLIPRGADNITGALGVVFDSDATGSDVRGERYTVMLGGPHWVDRAAPDADSLQDLALQTLRSHLGLSDEVEPIHIQTDLHRNCIPTYQPGHLDQLKALHQELMSNYDGRLSLIGASYKGVSVNDVAQSGWKVAHALRRGEVSTGLE